MKDLTGQRFGKLVVQEFAGKQGNFAMWKCQCDCGKEHMARGANLLSGQIKSCGCGARQNGLKHGDSKTRLYRIWYGIIRRTEDSSRKEYKDYGARGVRMCKEWRESYESFRAWALSNGYNDTLSIDRIASDGNYEPGNCRWATKSDQENNKRSTHLLSIDGVSKTPAEWSKISGIPASRIRRRKAKGWDDRRAVFEPLDVKRQHPPK